MSNPFSEAPKDLGGKHIFGTYQMKANRIEFEAGNEGYTLPECKSKGGEPWHFKGKKLNPKSKSVHVIQELTCEAKDGHEFVQFRDWLWSAKDVCYKAVIDSHKENFGDDLNGIYGKAVEIEAELLELDDKGYSRQCFKVVRVFKNKAERNAAREAYFAQFDDHSESNDNGSTTVATTNVPNGYTASAWAGTMKVARDWAAKEEAPKKQAMLVAYLVDNVIDLKGNSIEEITPFVLEALK